MDDLDLVDETERLYRQYCDRKTDAFHALRLALAMVDELERSGFPARIEGSDLATLRARVSAAQEARQKWEFASEELLALCRLQERGLPTEVVQ